MTTTLTFPPNLNKLIQAADYLVDRRVGIIRQVGEYLREPGDPELYCYFSKACNTQAFSKYKNFSDTGGVSIDRNLALAKALGEAVERYCAALYDESEFYYVSKNEAPFECIETEPFNFNATEQYDSADFPLSRFTDETRIRWVPSIELPSNTIKYVPAQAVFIPYKGGKKIDQEPLICQPISTGLACHETFEQAALSAICEVIERDAFTITWQAGIGASHIIVDSLSPANLELIRRIKKMDCELNLMDITLDSKITTILSTLRFSNPKSPALVVATSTELNPEIAIRKSLEELAYTRRYSQYLMDNTPPIDNIPPNFHIHNQGHHLRFWCDHRNLPLIEFLYSSKNYKEFKAIPNLDTGCYVKNLRLIVDHIKASGHNVNLIDITTPEIRSLGLFVVRAIIPGYHPLRMGHQIRAIGGKRLKHALEKLGYKNNIKESGETNLPHAFP